MTRTPTPLDFSFAKLFVLILLFLGGGWAGGALGQTLAPSAPLVWIPSFLMLPLSFVASVMLWQGFVLLVLLFRLPKLLKERHAKPPAPSSAEATVTEERGLQELRRRAWIMIPPPVLICSLAGVLVAFGAASFIMVVAAYFAVGVAYGLLLWGLAQKDLLFFGWEESP